MTRNIKKILYTSLFTACIGVSAHMIAVDTAPQKLQRPLSSLDTIPDDERIKLLITHTQKTLEKLQELEKALKNFRDQEKICIQEDEKKQNRGNDALFELSKKASELLDLIDENGLQTYFRKDFLEEITMLSKAYRTKALPSVRIEALPS